MRHQYAPDEDRSGDVLDALRYHLLATLPKYANPDEDD